MYDINAFVKQKRALDELPLRKVNRDGFIEAMVSIGKTREEAEFQAKIASVLKSEVVVNGERLRLV